MNRIVNNTKWNRLRMNFYGSKNTSNSPTTLNIPPFWTFFKSILVVILVKSNQTGKFKWFLICFLSDNGYLLVTKVCSNFIPKACRTLDGFRAHSIMIFGRIEVAFFQVTNFIYYINLKFSEFLRNWNDAWYAIKRSWRIRDRIRHRTLRYRDSYLGSNLRYSIEKKYRLKTK